MLARRPLGGLARFVLDREAGHQHAARQVAAWLGMVQGDRRPAHGAGSGQGSDGGTRQRADDDVVRGGGARQGGERASSALSPVGMSSTSVPAPSRSTLAMKPARTDSAAAPSADEFIGSSRAMRTGPAFLAAGAAPAAGSWPGSRMGAVCTGAVSGSGGGGA
jgi:hypothetical protein